MFTQAVNTIVFRQITTNTASLHSIQNPCVGELVYIQDTQELYVYGANGWAQITCGTEEKMNESFRPRVCERCGAPMHSNKCEYCGTEYW